LKDTFGEKVPAEIEKIKKLKRYILGNQGHIAWILTTATETTVPRLLVRLLLTRYMVVLEASSLLCGRLVGQS